MHRFIRRFGAFVLTATTIGFAAAGAVAFAGDDDDLVDDAPFAPGQNEPRVMIRNIEANIDNWVYGNRRNRGGGQQPLDLLLKMKTEEIARAVDLSETQKGKLLLAGQGDVRRFIDRVDEIKLKYQSNEMFQNDWNRIFQEIRPLQIALGRGLFGGDSLFAKTLTKMLTAEQAARYERAELDRRVYQHRARVEMTVLQLGTTLALGDDQRKRLVQLLLEKTRPLPSIGQQDNLVVLAQMSRLPEESLKPLFDARQWRQLQPLFDRVPQIMPLLRQNGIVLEDLEVRQKNAVRAEK